MTQSHACQTNFPPSSWSRMKTMIGVIILAVLCLGLGVAVFTAKKQAAAEKKKE